MGCTRTNKNRQHSTAGSLLSFLFKMIKIVLFLFLFGCTTASSSSNFREICEKESYRNTPTLCSNYLYIDDLNSTQLNLQNEFNTLKRNVDAIMNTLEESHKDLRQQLETKFTKIETDLDKETTVIQDLKKKVNDLVQHKESVEERIPQIEQRLGETENNLHQETGKLQECETKTKAAFGDIKEILQRFQKELSDVNTTASELENRDDSKLKATEQELKAKLTQIQSTSEGLSTSLEKQREKTESFINKAEVRFEKLDQQLETQSSAVTNQRAEIHSLSSRVDGISTRQDSADQQVSDLLRQLRSKVDSLTAAANATVAFSASITHSDDVFTGPGFEGQKILKFNKIFTNIGNAYCNSTGIFTAPVKGVYHFSFMTFGYNSHTSGAMLVVNGEYRVGTFEFKGTDTSDTTSSSVILELNPNDQVEIALWDGGKVQEAVFSAFLIFPLS